MMLAVRSAVIAAVACLLVALAPTVALARRNRPCAPGAPKDILHRRLRNAGVAAGALVVVRRGRVVFSGGFGRNAPGGKAVDPARSVFRAASNSKPFVATAVMQLVAQGRLDLQSNVNHYLRLFKVPDTFAAPVTLDSLLTHSAGFDDHFLGGLAKSSDDIVPLGPISPSTCRAGCCRRVKRSSIPTTPWRSPAT